MEVCSSRTEPSFLLGKCEGCVCVLCSYLRPVCFGLLHLCPDSRPGILRPHDMPNAFYFGVLFLKGA